VNGYHDASAEAAALFPTRIHYRTSSEGFSNVFNSRQRSAPGARFSDLLAAVAEIDPELRVRFTSPHPKDFPPDVLQAIAAYPNLCSSLHMPLQSGSNAMLQKMRRGYSREAFLELVDAARETIPRVTISTDVIAGFCGETEEDHRDTLDIMSRVRFDQAFMFAYSLRDKTHAARVFVDDVPEDVKLRRLQEIIDMFRTRAIEKNRATETNRVHLVLVEGLSQRQAAKDCAGAASCQWTGRTDGNKRVVFSIVSGADGLPMMPRFDVASTELEQLADLDAIAARLLRDSGPQRSVSTDTLRGTYVAVKILEANGTTLRGVALGGSSIADWNQSRRFST
jgi:MiaB/RimO family radical SAM methylthiotransferase